MTTVKDLRAALQGVGDDWTIGITENRDVFAYAPDDTWNGRGGYKHRKQLIG